MRGNDTGKLRTYSFSSLRLNREWDCLQMLKSKHIINSTHMFEILQRNTCMYTYIILHSWLTNATVMYLKDSCIYVCISKEILFQSSSCCNTGTKIYFFDPASWQYLSEGILMYPLCLCQFQTRKSTPQEGKTTFTGMGCNNRILQVWLYLPLLLTQWIREVVYLSHFLILSGCLGI